MRLGNVSTFFHSDFSPSFCLASGLNLSETERKKRTKHVPTSLKHVIPLYLYSEKVRSCRRGSRVAAQRRSRPMAAQLNSLADSASQMAGSASQMAGSAAGSASQMAGTASQMAQGSLAQMSDMAVQLVDATSAKSAQLYGAAVPRVVY